ncbi:MAG TPA: nuclear transport factor 2 family protein [Acidimicrobiia bacterium]
MNHALLQESIDKRPHVRDLLALAADDYAAVRDLWKAHSLAENARDIAGLMATLTDDCVYELVQTGHRWEGHEGATRFYTELLTAFPDIDFALTSIVVGPQGVCEEAVVNGTFSAPWLGVEPTEERLVWRNVIFFPWDPTARLFTGERVYSFFPDLPVGNLPAAD